MHNKYMRKAQSPYYLNTICSQEIRENKKGIQKNIQNLFMFFNSYNDKLNLSLGSDVYHVEYFRI